MLRVCPVDHLELPELAPYRTMRWQFEHRQQGIFVAEGEKVVRRLLESDLEVISLLLPPKWLENYRELLTRRKGEIQAFTAEKPLLEKLTGFSMYQGVLAVARVPAPLNLETVIAHSRKPLLLVAVDGISNADNLGGVIRNCAAFGASALVVGESSCSPYLRRAVRSSMGNVFTLPVVESANLVETIRAMQTAGIRSVAAHPHTTETTLPAADFNRDCCIVLGSEGQGISSAVLQACDQAILIPMSNQVDSLNVGTAAAVFLYEARRQRGFPAVQ
jgi:tRNA G18 (ribose-2'-O)-methylase SpoU